MASGWARRRRPGRPHVIEGNPIVASTVLAVDDSVTMRKVLEITFAGPDFKVITAATGDAALQKLASDKPDVVVCDLSLDPKTGYDICKAIKAASPGTPVVLLSSKHNPYDAAKGQGAQADDYIDKPFDTQQLIDKVRKLVSKGDVKADGALAPAGAGGPYRAAQKVDDAPASAAAKQPAAPTPVAPATAPTGVPQGGGVPAGRAKTLVYNPAQPAGAGKAPAPAAVAPGAKPEAAISAAVNGQMAKLEGLGLTPQQVEAVMALSRDVVERVVWEVVPVLAEALIKEEIARLTK